MAGAVDVVVAAIMAPLQPSAAQACASDPAGHIIGQIGCYMEMETGE
jgi:hypothetical protein